LNTSAPRVGVSSAVIVRGQVVAVLNRAPESMADKTDEMWSKALWPDCLNESAGSLMGMISDADMLHMMEDASKRSEQDISETQKDSAQVPDAADDSLDLEPPSKLQATCKLDSQAAKTKAYREKQRRAQLNNKCAYAVPYAWLHAFGRGSIATMLLLMVLGLPLSNIALE
jgi:hypothetical protein